MDQDQSSKLVNVKGGLSRFYEKMLQVRQISVEILVKPNFIIYDVIIIIIFSSERAYATQHLLYYLHKNVSETLGWEVLQEESPWRWLPFLKMEAMRRCIAWHNNKWGLAMVSNEPMGLFPAQPDGWRFFPGQRQSLGGHKTNIFEVPCLQGMCHAYNYNSHNYVCNLYKTHINRYEQVWN